MSGKEYKGLVRRNSDAGIGGPQASASRLHGPVEVPTIRVALGALRHPGNKGGLSGGTEGTTGGVLPGPLPWGGGAHAQPDNNNIYSQACGSCNTKYTPDNIGLLGRVMRGHHATL